MSEIFIKKFSLKKIKAKLYFDFHDLLQAFDSIITKNFLFHHFYNHKIDFVDDFHMMRSQIYSLFYLKLMKLKKYLKKNFKKNFISFNNVSFFSLILFVIKFNEEFCFCVDYYEFNIIIKRNNYFIFLIDKILTKFIEYKYITKLNIIATFNKFRMHSKNKNLITFICSLKIYKYYVFSFDLTNDFFNYQHYMNDILFDFFNKFVQYYLNDIFIYNKIKKKHIRHVRLILQKLIDANF